MKREAASTQASKTPACSAAFRHLSVSVGTGDAWHLAQRGTAGCQPALILGRCIWHRPYTKRGSSWRRHTKRGIVGAAPCVTVFDIDRAYASFGEGRLWSVGITALHTGVRGLETQV